MRFIFPPGKIVFILLCVELSPLRLYSLFYVLIILSTSTYSLEATAEINGNYEDHESSEKKG